MHFDSLDPRVMLATTPLDPTFGTGGKVSTPLGIGHVYATDDAVYVESPYDFDTAPSVGPTLTKYTSAGKLDTSWGSKGSVTLPTEMTQFAYDKRSGLLYVAGTGGGISSVDVMRFTNAGQLDTGFGTHGLADYTPVSTVSGATVSTNVTTILPLAGKRLMVGFDLTVATSSGNDDSVVLMKLRSNGTRDPAFGKKGKITVLGGYYHKATAASPTDYPVANAYRVPHIVDLVEQPQGLRVVMTRADGIDRQNTSTSAYSDDETFEVKLQTVAGNGQIDPATAYSWTLLKPLAGSADKSFQTIIARYDGKDYKHDHVSVVGRVLTNYGLTSTVTEPYLYSVSPGVRTDARRLDRRLTGVRAVYNRSPGIYFAANATAVVKISTSAASATDFADGGAAFFASGVSPIGVDPDGRLLLTSGDTLERVV